MDRYVDNWNLMAFDYQGGGFSNFTGHLNNVFESKSNPRSTNGWVVEENRFMPFNTKQAIDFYKANVASPRKIHLGFPLYGRSFANVVDLSKNGRGMGQKFNGSGEGSFEPGVLDYKSLPQNGSKVYTDKETLSSWSWDPVKKQLVTFDNPKAAIWKTDYLKKEGLGGAWWWESSGDRAIGSDKSLVSTVSFIVCMVGVHRMLTRYDRSSRNLVAQRASGRAGTIFTTLNRNITTFAALRPTQLLYRCF